MPQPASTDAVLGRIGLPESVASLAARQWDVIVVGAGHNGLTCAAYLARAGRRVLVLEASDRVGGACTLEATWPGYRVSPCAYLCGLLHPLVVRELDLPGHGFEWIPADAGMFVPFDDGTSIQLWNDAARSEQWIRDFAPGDVTGWRALGDLIRRVRDALRPDDDNDVWLGDAPDRDAVADRVDRDPNALGLLFDWSMNDLVERYLDDERLHLALLGQGVIGTNASPFDPGTAYIRFHHACGRMFGRPGEWGYVRGGMGTVSFILCDVARASGAVVATGVPVASILPREGVALSGGDVIRAPIVVSNADPRTTLRLVGSEAPRHWSDEIGSIPIEGASVKLNVALGALPDFDASPGVDREHHRGQVNTILTKSEWRDAYAAARSGRLPDRLWTELYFQSAVDRSVVPAGKHVMSVFAQYAPYRFADGDWDTRRDEVAHLALASIGRYASNIPGVVEHVEIMGPPDIERTIGITGGHIFHGECLPEYMWTNRPGCRTPVDGLYLCGAGTHPGGSVIAVNGRNCAMAVLNDTPDAKGST